MGQGMPPQRCRVDVNFVIIIGQWWCVALSVKSEAVVNSIETSCGLVIRNEHGLLVENML